MKTMERPRMLARTVPRVLFVLMASACGEEPPGPVPPTVTVAQPMRRDVQTFAEFTGTTRATEFAEVRARASGQLREMYFEPAQFVREGETLFLIEPEPYQAAYDEAVATSASAESELNRAESDLERIEQAIQSDAVSRQDLDRAIATRDQAYAALLAARARQSQAEINLGYTRVKTPVSGQVSRNFVDLGNLVGATEPTLLTTVTRIAPIWVYFNAPERSVLEFMAERQDLTLDGLEEPDQRTVVRVGTAVETDFPHEGELDFIDNTVDPATGTIELRAVLPNESHVLFPGLFVRIQVLGLVQPNAILIEERALGTDLGGKYVLVLGADNVVEQRYVTLGPVQADGSVVVQEGLDGSETYIVDGLLRARPGLPVTPETREQAAAAAGAGAEPRDAVSQGGGG